MSTSSSLTPPGPGDDGLLAEVLRQAGEQRQRVATRAATELLAEAGSKDQRAGAMRIARLLAEAGRLIEVADELAAGRLRLVAVDSVIVGTALDDTLEGGIVEVRIDGKVSAPAAAMAAIRKLTAVPTPPASEESPPVPEPTEVEVDEASAFADAVVDAAFPTDDPILGTVIGEEDRLPPDKAYVLPPRADALADGEVHPTPAREPGGMLAPGEDPREDDDPILPPGQGDDDDLSDLVDLAGEGLLDADSGPE